MSEEAKANEAEETKGAAEVVANLSAFYGIKAGMTRIFDENGNHVPVTVVKLVDNYVTQIKTTENDGYNAYQVGYYEKREKLVTKPIKGHLKKAGVDKNFTRFEELKVDQVNPDFLGKKINIDEFTPKTFIDVIGTSKGKGFQGVMKRFNFSGGPAAHGSKFHRTTGSIGNRATPGKVFKNKKLPGHMGDKRITLQNLQVVEVNPDKGYMLVKGSVPGPKNSFVKIQKARKK